VAKTDFDLIIVGGGMVGASLACALKNSDLKIAIIEALPAHSAQQPSYDDRSIALAYGSQRIFESIGLWPQLANLCTAITDIHVSDRGHFGVTRLSAQTENVPALGQVITARSMGIVLNKALEKQENIEFICPAKVVALLQHADHVTVTLDNQREISAKLIVAADGANSTIKHLLDLGSLDHNYNQTAITANITPERAHNGRAFERFTDSGPIALLPMSDNRCSLVWTVKAGDETEILSLSEQDFLSRLQDQDNVINNTNTLVTLFSNNNSVLGHLRGAGLTLIDALPVAKHWLAQKSMGLGKKQPRLARGIKL
jgi:2-octaprenyl-6-methoxyphenol hydroxylase